MNKKAWIIFTAVVIVLLAALVIFSQQSKVEVGDVDPNTLQSATALSGNIADHIKNDASNQVTIIEYGDYACPGCREAYKTLNTVIKNNPDKVKFIFRNLPLSSLHPNARAAAAAAESAGLQGKYWEMHDLLYENQTSWDELAASKRVAFFTEYAATLGLDTDKFKADIESDAVRDKIAYDQAVFAKTGLQASTPTILLNGKKVESATWNNAAVFQKAIDSAYEISE